MKERRKLERFRLRVPTRIVGERGGHALELVTSDICAGGAFFHTDQPLPEGTRVRVDLLLPLARLRKMAEGYDLAHVRITGRVLRNESGGMAVCFGKDYSIKPQKGKRAVRH